MKALTAWAITLERLIQLPLFGDTDVQLDDHLDPQENLEPTLTFWNPLFWWIQRHEPNVRDKFMSWKGYVSTRRRHSNSLAPIRTTDQFYEAEHLPAPVGQVVDQLRCGESSLMDALLVVLDKPY